MIKFSIGEKLMKETLNMVKLVIQLLQRNSNLLVVNLDAKVLLCSENIQRLLFFGLKPKVILIDITKNLKL